MNIPSKMAAIPWTFWAKNGKNSGLLLDHDLHESFNSLKFNNKKVRVRTIISPYLDDVIVFQLRKEEQLPRVGPCDSPSTGRPTDTHEPPLSPSQERLSSCQRYKFHHNRCILH